MGKRERYRDHIDPEYQRWGRKYPRFPGVAECVRLIRNGKARGAWADIIAFELAANAAERLPELIEAFHKDESGTVRLYVMMVLETAPFPGAVPFLKEVLNSGDPECAPYALRTLEAIGTREARTALWEARRTS